MLSYCLKCRKNTESKNPNVEKPNGRIMFYQNVQCVIAENRNLLKSKKLEDY